MRLLTTSGSAVRPLLLLPPLLLLGAGQARADQPKPGDAAPAFMLPQLSPEEGKMVSLQRHVLGEDGKGKKLIVLSFFSMSCKPCKRELPWLDKVVAAHGDKLSVWVIDIDKEEPEYEAAKKLFEEMGLKLPVLKDRFQIVQRRYQVDTLPSCFFLDPRGKVTVVSTGYSKETQALIASTIKEAVGAELPPVEGHEEEAKAEEPEEEGEEPAEKPKKKKKRKKKKKKKKKRKKR